MENIKLLPKWIDSNLYPFKNRYLNLSAGKMHFVDEGQGDVILFVHGTPTWSFLYRDYIKELSKTNRCIAIDHLGFGLSEKPPIFKGKPENHSANLLEFIDKLGLNNTTLVVHDFGGPIGLSAAIKTSSSIKRIVLFNSWLWETKSNIDVRKIDKILNGWVGKFLYLNLNFSTRYLLKKAYYNKKMLTKLIHSHYISPFQNKKSRIPLLELGKSLLGSSDWYANQGNMLSKLSDKPWLIIWGKHDKLINMDDLDRWKEMIPTAQIHEFESGHFVQEEKAGESIQLLKEFIRNN